MGAFVAMQKIPFLFRILCLPDQSILQKSGLVFLVNAQLKGRPAAQ